MAALAVQAQDSRSTQVQIYPGSASVERTQGVRADHTISAPHNMRLREQP